jgi:hypothetical protein
MDDLRDRVVASLARQFDDWPSVPVEVREILVAGEKLHALHADDDDIPKLLLAAPYVLAVEREFIEFLKRGFPGYLRSRHPERPLESYASSQYRELYELLFDQERISLGHVVSWMSIAIKGSPDELFTRFGEYLEAFDPEHRLFFSRRAITILTEKLLVHRKLIVHVSRKERWFGREVVDSIRELTLSRFDGREPGLLPLYFRLERNVAAFLPRESVEPSSRRADVEPE